MVHLGIYLNDRLRLGEHVKRTTIKAQKAVRTLCSLMANVSGLGSQKGMLLVGVIISVWIANLGGRHFGLNSS